MRLFTKEFWASSQRRDAALALAAAAEADVLVTRDEDLLALQKHGKTEIVHVTEFLRRLAMSTSHERL